MRFRQSYSGGAAPELKKHHRLPSQRKTIFNFVVIIMQEDSIYKEF